MLDKEQSDVIAETLLSPAREEQEAARKRAEEQRRKHVAQRRYAWCGLAGFIVGGVIGYLAFDDIFPSAGAGLALGFILSPLLSRRAV